jgi:hypothetical protein
MNINATNIRTPMMKSLKIDKIIEDVLQIPPRHLGLFEHGPLTVDDFFFEDVAQFDRHADYLSRQICHPPQLPLVVDDPFLQGSNLTVKRGLLSLPFIRLAL